MGILEIVGLAVGFVILFPVLAVIAILFLVGICYVLNFFKKNKKSINK